MAAIYATPADLAAYVKDNDEADVSDDAMAERVLERAERDVDRLCGPWPILASGRKFDPEELPDYAVARLRNATCAAAEYRLLHGEEFLAGSDEYLPLTVTAIRTAGRAAPKVLEELSGGGLFAYSGTVLPDVVV